MKSSPKGPGCGRRRWQRTLVVLLVTLALPSFMLSLAHEGAWELRVCAGSNDLPYSNHTGQGFENRIAEILAEDLGAELVNVWTEETSGRALLMSLQQGACDVVMGVGEGNPHLSVTVAYYRSSYMFVYRSDAPFTVESLDDPLLGDLTIGVQAGASGVSPVVYALAKRNLIDNQVTYLVDSSRGDSLGAIVEEVARGKVDIAIVWGPVAGFFAERQEAELRLVSVTPQIELPFVPMVHAVSIGVRFGDEALRDRLNLALARRWTDIQHVLSSYNVPLEPLPAPTIEER